MEKSYEPWRAYQRSKICNILFTRSLAKRLENTRVTVNALHPGIIATELSKYYADAYNIPKWLFQLVLMITFPLRYWVFKSVNQGAQTQIYCSVSEHLKGINGVYFVDCKPKAYMPFVLDDNFAERVWKITEELVNK
jgi:hypothetical protein